MVSGALALEGVSVSIGGAEILHDVSFELAEGQLLAVIGPNGAGKSTLLRCVDGLIERYRGVVRLAGISLDALSRRQLARLVSYVPQVDGATAPFTVQAFVEMGRYPHLNAWSGLGREDEEAVDRALLLTETTSLRDRDLASLSGGERQRVLIAAALAQGSSMLLLDEPTSFLDFRHQVQIIDLLERLHREQGLTIVAVTHDLNNIAAVCDRVLALKGGRVVFFDTPVRLLDRHLLAGIYGTDFVLVNRASTRHPIVVPRANGR